METARAAKKLADDRISFVSLPPCSGESQRAAGNEAADGGAKIAFSPMAADPVWDILPLPQAGRKPYPIIRGRSRTQGWKPWATTGREFLFCRQTAANLERKRHWQPGPAGWIGSLLRPSAFFKIHGAGTVPDGERLVVGCSARGWPCSSGCGPFQKQAGKVAPWHGALMERAVFDLRGQWYC